MDGRQRGGCALPVRYPFDYRLVPRDFDRDPLPSSERDKNQEEKWI